MTARLLQDVKITWSIQLGICNLPFVLNACLQWICPMSHIIWVSHCCLISWNGCGMLRK
jgi:hypothetical protein